MTPQELNRLANDLENVASRFRRCYGGDTLAIKIDDVAWKLRMAAAEQSLNDVLAAFGGEPVAIANPH